MLYFGRNYSYIVYILLIIQFLVTKKISFSLSTFARYFPVSFWLLSLANQGEFVEAEICMVHEFYLSLGNKKNVVTLWKMEALYSLISNYKWHNPSPELMFANPALKMV